MSAMSQPPGGFILSPPLSTTSSAACGNLPRPRASPLRPGGSKESTFIRYVDEQILHIQRRFAKRTSPDANGDRIERDAAAIWDNVEGYASMREVCKEMEDLVNTIWISGTPSLQIAYLLSVARLLTTVIPAMPPTPKQLFRLLAKLDHAFASLLQGRDLDTGEALPGFNTGRGVSGTEKVRVRSVVERTRKSVVEAFRSPDFEIENVESDDGMEVEDLSGRLEIEGDDVEDDGDDDLDVEMQIARVYDRTVIELGDSLETPDIGIITE